MKRKHWIALSLILMSSFLFSCTPSSHETSSSSIQKQIILSHHNLFLEVGESQEITATLNYEDPSFLTFEWLSTDEEIISFQEGKIYALQEGTAEIIVSYLDLEESCRVMVLPLKDMQENSGEIHMYAMNDFHGAIESSGKEIGLLKNGTFFKEKRKEENTLIFNSGDMFQGSIYSNSNYGEFLAKCMNNIGFDCFTLGNHEFDWGQKYIQKNRKLKDEKTDYATPYLGANIYHYDMKTHSILNQASDLVDPYVIRELNNGLRVGIIGVIGEDQISSITSNYVDDLDFVVPTKIIKELSDELRMNKKCDVVILDAHASYQQIDKSITEVSQKTNKKYIDAAFLAHSHQFEEYEVNQVPFVQGSSNGKAYSEIHLTLENGNVVKTNYTSHQNGNLATNQITNYDTELVQLYEFYTKSAEEKAKENLGVLNGNLYSSCDSESPLPNLVVKAMAEEAKKQGYKVDFAICNNARASLYSGNLTYEKLYKALPFDNELHILRVRGDSIIRQSRYNSVYRVLNKTISSSEYYTIVVIDYLAFHRNTSRNYDYFSDQKHLGKLEKEGKNIYSYRDLVADYIRKNKTIDASDFAPDNACFHLL